MSNRYNEVIVSSNYQILPSDDIIQIGTDVITLTLPAIDVKSILEGWEVWIYPNFFVQITVETPDSTFHETNDAEIVLNAALQACRCAKISFRDNGWIVEYDFIRHTKYLSFPVLPANTTLAVGVLDQFITIPQKMLGWYIVNITYTLSVGPTAGTDSIQLEINGTTEASTAGNITAGNRFITSYPHFQVFEGDVIKPDITAVSGVVPGSGLAIVLELSPY